MAEYTFVAEKTGEVRLRAEEKEARYEEIAAAIGATIGEEPGRPYPPCPAP
jgi:hypothetical protein